MQQALNVKRVHRKPCGATMRGASLIEVLIAIVIFAFGTLGLAGLQVRVLSFGQSSMYRSQATALTDDVLDRMRADRVNAKAGRWNTVLGTAASAITGTQIYETDLHDWKTQVETLLPSGRASITVTTTDVTVTIDWLDDRKNEATEAFTTHSRL